MTESWKNVSGVLESPGKVLEFSVSKRVGTLQLSDVNLYSALSCSRLHLESAQIWPACNKGITQFLPATHI